jgi:hypothetical protein
MRRPLLNVLWDVRTLRFEALSAAQLPFSLFWVSRGVNWYLITDVTGPTGCTETSVNNYMSVLILVTAYVLEGTNFIPKI